MVIDRLQLFLFLAVTIGGTVGILINAPHIFEFVDQDEIRDKIMGNNEEWELIVHFCGIFFHEENCGIF